MCSFVSGISYSYWNLGTLGAFYGSAFVEMSSPDVAERLVVAANAIAAAGNAPPAAAAASGKGKAKGPKQPKQEPKKPTVKHR